jgi:hypothetical protein
MALKGKRRYWYSKDLKKPEVIYNRDMSDIDLITVFEALAYTVSVASLDTTTLKI